MEYYDVMKRGLAGMAGHMEDDVSNILSASSAESVKVFKQYRYFSAPDEAFVWLDAEKPIGGEYIILPSEWVAR